ncbi:reverse transcriptase domain, reverse transcriptase zinc-binding domain protein [Tanacetum coccineum]
MESEHYLLNYLDSPTSQHGLEVGSIRRIQGIGYSVLEFLGVGTTFDIFQNIHILYLQYGVLTSSGYGVLIFFPLWSLNSICLRATVVDWYKVVWFPYCIPRHAIHLWLVVKQKLKTQDRLRQWDADPAINLNLLRCPMYMSAIPPRIKDALAFITPISKGNSILRIISHIVLAAATYYLWNERNSRLFKKRVSFAEQVFHAICYTVRLKLVTFKFKKVSARSHLLLDRWKVPSKGFLRRWPHLDPLLTLYCCWHRGVLAWLQEFFLLVFANVALIPSLSSFVA